MISTGSTLLHEKRVSDNPKGIRKGYTMTVFLNQCAATH